MSWLPTSDPSSLAVPGVDPSLPAAVQIEQIDQLITLKLASIDNNLARVHQILTSDILPSVQRFAQASRPTRDAARFWKSFFELAAQVRVPTADEFTMTEATATDAEGPSHTIEKTENETVTLPNDLRAQSREDDLNAENGQNRLGESREQVQGEGHSFAGVTSSTPLRASGDVSTVSVDDNTNAWAFSHESIVGAAADQRPIPPFLVDISSISGGSGGHNMFDQIISPPVVDKGKKKADNLRQAVLRRVSRGEPSLVHFNPFLPNPSASEGKWDGLVDLSTSPSLSAASPLPDFAKANYSSSSADSHGRIPRPTKDPGLQKQALDDFSSSSIQFPPPNPELLRVAATPSKKAADLVVQDLLAGLSLGDTPTDRFEAQAALHFNRQPISSAPAARGPRPSILAKLQNPHLDYGDDDGGIDDTDSFDDFDDDQHGYSGGPGRHQYDKMMPIPQGGHDDSFNSDMSSFDDDDDGAGEEGSFGGGMMDGPPEEATDTLFGPRSNPPPPQHGFVLDGDSMHTYMHGGRLEDAAPAQPSPTPFAGEYRPLRR